MSPGSASSVCGLDAKPVPASCMHLCCVFKSIRLEEGRSLVYCLHVYLLVAMIKTVFFVEEHCGCGAVQKKTARSG